MPKDRGAGAANHAQRVHLARERDPALILACWESHPSVGRLRARDIPLEGTAT